MKRIFGCCLLLAGLSRAVQVYLNPLPSLPSTLSPGHASFALSRHLGLEVFESLRTQGESLGNLLDEPQFVGQGANDALLLSINEEIAGDVLPLALKPAFSLSNAPPIPSLSSLISTYVFRARHAYTSFYTSSSQPEQSAPRILDLFSVSTPSTDTFLIELAVLSDFLDATSTPDKFCALELTGLPRIAEAFGRTSDQYRLAAQATRAMLESALSQPNLHLALLTFTPVTEQGRVGKRDTQPPEQTHLPIPGPMPQQPISSISTCFATVDACTHSTRSCSGRGECMKASKAGRTCFVCLCRQVTNAKGKRETWVGDACERKDVSGPFTLITGTVIVFIILIGMAISLLSSVGNQELPSVLLAGATGGLRKD